MGTWDRQGNRIYRHESRRKDCVGRKGSSQRAEEKVGHKVEGETQNMI